MKKTLAWFILLIMLCALPGGGALAARDTLYIGSLTRVSGDFFTGMWGKNTSDMDIRMLIHGYDTIYWLEDETVQTNPRVVKALQWSKAENGDPVATIELHRDLRFSDGSALTARDYVFSLLLEASPLIAELGGQVAYMDQLRGTMEYATGESPVLSGVRLLSDYKYAIQIRAESLPYYYQNALLHALPYPMAVIAPGCEVKDDGEGAYITGMTVELLNRTINDPETGYRSHPTVSSGAYRLVSYDPANGVVEFERNPYFKGSYDGQKPSIPRIVLTWTRNQTLLDDLQSGKLDLVNKISAAQSIKAVSAPAVWGSISTASYPRRGLGELVFGADQPLTSSVLMRQAIAHMTDRQGLVSSFLEGFGEPVYGFYGMAQWMPQLRKADLKSLDLYAYDQDKALALLKEDGWTLNAEGGDYDPAQGGLRHKMIDGQPVPLQLRMAITPQNMAADYIAERLSGNLAALGGELQVSEMAMNEMLLNYYHQKHEDRRFDLYFLGTNFDMVYNPYFNFHTDEMYHGVYNTTGIKDEKLMQLADELRRTEPGNHALFLNRWFALQQRIAEVLPMVPLYSNTYYDAFGKQLKNYHPERYDSWSLAVLYAFMSDE